MIWLIGCRFSPVLIDEAMFAALTRPVKQGEDYGDRAGIS
ncbi:hypothetical protein AGRO_4699 [Agrobacterium sp. ATCC 31749]|nr:hypothetical protein AGRO_4699 [Agrobacterium sp. ATCC 31749]